MEFESAKGWNKLGADEDDVILYINKLCTEFKFSLDDLSFKWMAYSSNKHQKLISLEELKTEFTKSWLETN